MARRHCPACGAKLPYAARRCRQCGWDGGTRFPSAHRTGRRLLLAAVALLAVLTLARYAAPGLNASRVADLYARFAFNYLPRALLLFAPGESATGAYFYCAQRVVKRVKDEHSVETFPSIAESETAMLAEGRYRVASYVDQVSETGAISRHHFVCTVRYANKHWLLEELAMGRCRRR